MINDRMRSAGIDGDAVRGILLCTARRTGPDPDVPDNIMGLVEIEW
jgi:hypothetical protein